MITSPIWLPAALFAGLFQAWRTAIQQKLRAELSVSGAGLVRYAYGAPFAIAMALTYLTIRDQPWPTMPPTFVAYAAAGGVAQILGTALLIMSFGYRGFVVGTAFSKTEAVQAAIVATILLGERLSPLAWTGVLSGVTGVLVLALAGRNLRGPDYLAALGQPAALTGLSAGAMFALTGVLVKRATQELALDDQVAAALMTLAVVMVLQTLIHGAYIAVREPGTLRDVTRTWRTSGQVGLLAAAGSACWFTGFATAPVALVRVVGQVEVIFTLAFARIYIGERPKRHEVAGLLLVALGVVLALTGAG